MTELEAFIARGHRKVIEHYRWLRDTSPNDVERERFQRCMDEEEQLLRGMTEERDPLRHAA